jgi:polygalacturonase
MGQGRSGSLGSRLFFVLWAVWLWLASGGLVRAGTPPLPVIPATNFNITNFGAFGNGVSNNATAIQSAINAAGAAGGGTVIVAAVGVLTNYLSGPFNLTNNVCLQINTGTKLQMLPMSSWPNSSTPFIRGSKLHDVAISGQGTIDGQGAAWWTAFNSNGSLVRPDMIILSTSTNLLFQTVTLQNPPIYHLVLDGTNQSVTAQNLNINTVSPSPNTDGIDLSATNCLIQNCSISGGDDNISIKTSNGLAVDVVISNCTFGTGHGVSMGSQVQYGVHELTVSNCTFNGTDYGIRMKSDNDRGGLVQNLKYSDITMTNVKYPIVIYSYYNEIGTPSSVTPATAAGEPVSATNSLTPIWRNITINNVTATALTGQNISGIIWGRPEMVVSNVTLRNVSITAPTKTFCIYNARGIQIIDSNLTAPNTTTNTLTLYNAEVTITNDAPNANLVTLGGLAKPPTNNVLAFFNSQGAIDNASMLGPAPLLTLAGSTVTVNNNLTLGGTSTLNFGVGTNVTEVAVTGNLTLGGTLNVADAGGFTTGTYTLFTYGGTLSGSGLNIGTTPAGYSYAISTNTSGQVRLVVTSPLSAFQAWQMQYFGNTNCALCGGDADFDGDGVSNTNEFLAGTNPTNAASLFGVKSVASQGDDVVITWTTSGGHTNAVQATGGAADGSYATDGFADISTGIVAPGTGDETTNYVDVGGATNFPSRYYRVRLVP